MTKKNFIKMILLAMIIILIYHPISYANSIEYKGKLEGLIETGGDMFSSFGAIYPGDVKNGYAQIKNTTNHEVEIFFKTEPINKADEKTKKLIQLLKLKITLEHNGKKEEIYNGNLEATEMQEYISLGKYEKGYDGKFNFQVEVPLNIDNEFALMEVNDIKWTFMVEDTSIDVNGKNENNENNEDKNIESKNNENNEDKNIESKNNENNKDKNTESKNDENTSNIANKEKNAQTGDKIFLVVAVLGISIVIYILTGVITQRKRKEKDKK